MIHTDDESARQIDEAVAHCECRSRRRTWLSSLLIALLYVYILRDECICTPAPARAYMYVNMCIHVPVSLSLSRVEKGSYSLNGFSRVYL